MAQKFIALVAGKLRQITATVISLGAESAGQIPCFDSTGHLDATVLPVGIGLQTQQIAASEGLNSGSFVNIHTNSDSGTVNVRLADNSNGRPADGFVLSVVAKAAMATVFPLGSPNTALTGLAPGAEYWLGIAGAVTATPLDETASDNTLKISQCLGKAKSATELITNDNGYVVL